MNPADRGWFMRFIRRQVLLEQDYMMRTVSEAISQGQHVQQFLYQLLQPTGLMYGFPVRFIGSPPTGSGDWTEKDKIKILLTEAFLYAGLFYHWSDADESAQPTQELIEGGLTEKKHADFEFPQSRSLYGFKLRDRLPAILDDLERFYEDHVALIPSGARASWRKRPKIEDRLEAIIDRRIALKYDWRNFWNSFFHNSLLFFDLIDFLTWKENKGADSGRSILMHRQAMRFDILKIIAAAAHSDGKVTKEEKELFLFFLESARLPAHRKRQAEVFFRDGLALADMHIETLDAWLLKKYFLELAILTVWMNREISPKELQFLHVLTKQIGLEEKDLQLSLDQIRSFVLQYWDQVHYLTIRQNYRVVSEQMMRRLFTIVKENQRILINEVRGSRDLAQLIGKYTTGDITNEEKEQLRNGLLDVLKAIPAYSYLLLPGSFFTLPILIRVLPRSLLFPNTYREEQKEERKSRQK